MHVAKGRARMSIRNRILGGTCAVLLAMAGCSSVSPDGKEWVAPSQGENTAETAQALTGTHKVCSAVTFNNWRDSINVDDGWSFTTCQGWAASVGAERWQV